MQGGRGPGPGWGGEAGAAVPGRRCGDGGHGRGGARWGRRARGVPGLGAGGVPEEVALGRGEFARRRGWEGGGGVGGGVRRGDQERDGQREHPQPGSAPGVPPCSDTGGVRGAGAGDGVHGGCFPGTRVRVSGGARDPLNRRTRCARREAPRGGSEGKAPRGRPPRGRLRREAPGPGWGRGPGGLGALLRGARCYLPEVFAAFAAFAAAFISCLWARTFARDSGPLMSAMERKESGSP